MVHKIPARSSSALSSKKSFYFPKKILYATNADLVEIDAAKLLIVNYGIAVSTSFRALSQQGKITSKKYVSNSSRVTIRSRVSGETLDPILARMYSTRPPRRTKL